MPSSSTQVTGCLAVMMMVLAAPVLWLGGIGVLYETGEARLVWAVIVAGALMMVVGPLYNLHKHRREVLREARHRAEILAAVEHLSAPAPDAEPPKTAGRQAALPLLPSGEAVLAYWAYEGEQWQAHVDREAGRGCGNALVLAISMFLVGLFVGWGDPWVIPVSAGLGVLVLVLSLLFAQPRHGTVVSGPPAAVITPTALVLNGEYHTLRGGPFKLQGVTYSESNAVLQFNVAVRRAYEPAYVRVPVPPGREAEAEAVARTLTNRLFDEKWDAEARRRRPGRK
jgi:hypothetical protein